MSWCRKEQIGSIEDCSKNLQLLERDQLIYFVIHLQSFMIFINVIENLYWKPKTQLNIMDEHKMSMTKNILYDNTLSFSF